jgi:hypothetical protein
MNLEIVNGRLRPVLYHGHCSHIGMATTLTMNGVPEYVIKDIGGWSRDSSAFKSIRSPLPCSLGSWPSRFDGHAVPEVKALAGNHGACFSG